MFRSNKEFSQKYFPLFENAFGFAKRARQHNVDFSQAWYNIFKFEIKRLAVVFFLEIVIRSFMATFPIILSLVITRMDKSLFYLASIGYLSVYVVGSFVMHNYTIAVANLINSVYYSAVKFFLVVDPKFHVSRSSGQVISKVGRGSEAVESILDVFMFELSGALAGLLAVVIAIININFEIGIYAMISVILLCSVAVFNQILRVNIVTPAVIESEDNLKAAGVETLQQVNHIRSSFASNEQINKVRNLTSRFSSVQATKWLVGIFATNITRVLFVVSFMVVGTITLDKINENLLPLPIAIGLLGSFLTASTQIIFLGRAVERFSDRISRLIDLFDFIRSFGKQTYPVLD
ncbi:MAG: hypothetical protein AAGF07_02770 [Patescibacteria group bacterium]